MDSRRKQVQLKNQINEQEVLASELSNIKKGAKVYKQQKNSNVYFLADKDKMFSQCKNTLDCLQKEYKEAEKTTQDEQEGEETEEVDT